VGGWIFLGSVVVVVIVGLLALDWFTAGRVGRRLGRKPPTLSRADYDVMQAELRRGINEIDRDI
jgi:hypothetical protein